MIWCCNCNEEAAALGQRKSSGKPLPLVLEQKAGDYPTKKEDSDEVDSEINYENLNFTVQNFSFPQNTFQLNIKYKLN